MSPPWRYININIGRKHDADSVEAGDIARWDQRLPLLVGGGPLLSRDSQWADTMATIVAEKGKRRVVVWGAGVGAGEHYADWVYDCDQVGVRDWKLDDALSWVPCASCLHPAFNRIPPIPKVQVVAYVHHNSVHAFNDVPVMTSKQGCIARVLDFMWQAETVVTNSYHGAYWATLSRRKVLLVPRPELFEQFMHFRHQPLVSNPGNWKSHVADAPYFPEALNDCRKANAAFSKCVLQK